MRKTTIVLIVLLTTVLVFGGLGCTKTATPTSSPSPVPTPKPTPTPTPTSTPLGWFDGRVGIVVDKVERTTDLPPEILESFQEGQKKPQLTPAAHIEEAGDKLEVVLHPVVDFVEKQLLLLQRHAGGKRGARSDVLACSSVDRFGHRTTNIARDLTVGI